MKIQELIKIKEKVIAAANIGEFNLSLSCLDFDLPERDMKYTKSIFEHLGFNVELLRSNMYIRISWGNYRASSFAHKMYLIASNVISSGTNKKDVVPRVEKIVKDFLNKDDNELIVEDMGPSSIFLIKELENKGFLVENKNDGWLLIRAS